MWAVRHHFGRSKSGLVGLAIWVFNLNDQLRSGKTFDVDEDALLDIVKNKLKVPTEETAKTLAIYIAIAFCHLKRVGSKQIDGFW